MSSPGVGKLPPGETNFQRKESRLRQKVKDRFTRSEPVASFCRKLISRSRVQKKERGRPVSKILSLASTPYLFQDLNPVWGDLEIGFENPI